MDGVIALDEIDRLAPDLVVLDLNLPRLDGYGVLSHLRARPATQRLPVIVLTAKGDEDSEVRVFEYGASDYLTKPFRAARPLGAHPLAPRPPQGERQRAPTRPVAAGTPVEVGVVDVFVWRPAATGWLVLALRARAGHALRRHLGDGARPASSPVRRSSRPPCANCARRRGSSPSGSSRITMHPFYLVAASHGAAGRRLRRDRRRRRRRWR